MDEKIILKPTDYVVSEDGKLGYSYDYESQYRDAEHLDSLPKDALIDECKRRRNEAFSFPVPSNISKYSLAKDLAFAKGFVQGDSDGLQVQENGNEGSEREF